VENACGSASCGGRTKAIAPDQKQGTPMITHEQKIKCLQREIALRQRVYPRWVQEQRRGWTQEKADHEIKCMEAILEDLVKSTQTELQLHNPPR
jgi:hypothetical protein